MITILTALLLTTAQPVDTSVDSYLQNSTTDQALNDRATTCVAILDPNKTTTDAEFEAITVKYDLQTDREKADFIISCAMYIKGAVDAQPSK